MASKDNNVLSELGLQIMHLTSKLSAHDAIFAASSATPLETAQEVAKSRMELMKLAESLLQLVRTPEVQGIQIGIRRMR